MGNGTVRPPDATASGRWRRLLLAAGALVLVAAIVLAVLRVWPHSPGTDHHAAATHTPVAVESRTASPTPTSHCPDNDQAMAAANTAQQADRDLSVQADPDCVGDWSYWQFAMAYRGQVSQNFTAVIHWQDSGYVEALEGTMLCDHDDNGDPVPPPQLKNAPEAILDDIHCAIG